MEFGSPFVFPLFPPLLSFPSPFEFPFRILDKASSTFFIGCVFTGSVAFVVFVLVGLLTFMDVGASVVVCVSISFGCATSLG